MSRPEEIWIGRGAERLGPYSGAVIEQQWREGNLGANDLLWWDGAPTWLGRDEALRQLGLIADVAPDSPRSAPPTLIPVSARTDPSTTRAGVAQGFALLIVAGLVLAGLVPALLSLIPSPPLQMSPAPASDAEMLEARITAQAAVQAATEARPDVALEAETPATDIVALEPADLARRTTEAIALAMLHASAIKVAYSEYYLSTLQPPDSLQALGIDPVSDGLGDAFLDQHTLILVLHDGRQLALQPFGNGVDRLDWRCGKAPAPPGISPVGQIDSAAATTVDVADLPEHCR